MPQIMACWNRKLNWRTQKYLHLHTKPIRTCEIHTCKWRNGSLQVNITWFAIFRSSLSTWITYGENYICDQALLFSMIEPPPSPFNLNNNLISYRHTITQFTHRHLAARTLSVRTRKVLHTLEYGTCDSWTSLVIWKRWKCDPVRTVCHSSVLSMIGRVVSFFATQCLVDYICICHLKIAFSTKKRQIQRDGKYLERNVLHIKYFIFSASTRGQFFFSMIMWCISIFIKSAVN